MSRRHHKAQSAQQKIYEDDKQKVHDNAKGKVYVDKGVRGWKIIFLLPYKTIWSTIVLLMSICSVYKRLYDASLHLSEKYILVYVVPDLMLTVDVILRIVARRLTGLKIAPDATCYPCWILAMDVLGCLPLVVLPNNNVKYWLELNVCLKCFRVFYYFSWQHTMIGSSSKLVLIVKEFMFRIVLAILVCYAMTYELLCKKGNFCGERLTMDDVVHIIYMAASRITARGPAKYPDDTRYMVIVDCVQIVAYIMVIMMAITQMINTMVARNAHQFYFLNTLQLVNKYCVKFNIASHHVEKLKSFFETYWSKRRGYNIDKTYIEELIPHVLYKQLCTDISRNALQRSRIFRELNAKYVRYLSLQMRQTYLTAGEVVFRKTQPKNMMVYLVSGVIEVLSEEDDETPVLSLSGGTCLGEMSLFFDLHPIVTVRCKTFCVVHVLRKLDFRNWSTRYPDQFLDLLKNATARIEDAKTHRATALELAAQQNVDERDRTSLVWLKSTLHSLMSKDNHTSTAHMCQNVFLREEFETYDFDKMALTTKFLDLIPICDRLELVSDTVFVKVACPCVLQPNSIVLKVWNTFILLLAFVVALIVPYFAFVVTKATAWYMVFFYTITLVWVLDLYIQISTGIKSENEVILEINKILLHRLGEPGFWFDVYSAFPQEAFAGIVRSTDLYLLLHLNRILKLWKFELLFRKWENQIDTNMITVRCIKFFLFFSYIIYFFTGCLYSFNCYGGKCRTEQAGYVHHFLTITKIMVSSGAETAFIDETFYDIFYTAAILVSIIFYIVALGNITAAVQLQLSRKQILIQKYSDIITILKARGILHNYRNRLFNCFWTQWKDNSAASVIQEKSIFRELPDDVFFGIRESAYMKLIRSLTVFEHLSDRVILEIAVSASSYIYPPNEVVIYAGESADAFYVILQGYCELVSSSTGLRECVAGMGDTLGLPEAFLQVPIISTIVSITHCRILTIKYSALMNIFFKAHIDLHLENLRDDIAIATPLSRLAYKNPYDLRYSIERRSRNSKSFRKFGYNLPKDSDQEFEYHAPFNKSYVGFVRFVLLRYTVLPDGPFIFKWEIVRCVLAVTSAMLFPTTACRNCVYYFVRIALDVTAWIDLYFRLHVCYYDKKGILVTHPLKTAWHYITHGFIVDFLAVVPVCSFLNPDQSTSHYRISRLLQINRVLQMHRFLSFFSYLESEYLTKRLILYNIKCFVMLLALSVIVGGFIMNAICKFNANIKNPTGSIYPDGIKCPISSWISQSNFTKPLSYFQIQCYGVYFAANTLTLSGIPGYKLITDWFSGLTMFLFILGYCILIYINASIISRYVSFDNTIISYQAATRGVQRFMDNMNVRTFIQKLLTDHYELHWKRTRGKELLGYSSACNQALLQDILYDTYGKLLKDSPFTAKYFKAFCRQVLPHSVHRILMKDSPILSVNTVTKYTYILIKGRATVYAADQTKLTTLYPGSMFGCLDNCKHVRQTVNITSHSHVEVLIANSLKFHEILRKYPTLLAQYNALTALHWDYIEVKSESKQEVRDASYTSLASSSMRISSNTMASKLFRFIVKSDSIFFKIWKVVFLVVPCYIEVILNMYQGMTGYYNVYIIAFQYLCDVLFLIDYYLVFHTSFENELGFIIADMKSIRVRFYEDKFKFWTSTISLVPLDILVWCIPMSPELRHAMFGWFRVNRYLRLACVIDYFIKKNRQLNTNMFLNRTIFLLASAPIIVHFYTCLLIWLACSVGGIKPNIACAKIGEVTKYAKCLDSVINLMIRTSHQLYHADSILVAWYLIVCMISFELILANFLGLLYDIYHMYLHEQNTYTSNVAKLDNFMRREHLSHSLFVSIWNYVRYCWRDHRGRVLPLLIKEAPYYLREMVMNSAFGYHINKHPVFKKCHFDFNRQVVECLRPVPYFRGDYIVFQGGITDQMYFIHSGEVVVLAEDDEGTERYVGSLRAGDSFGIEQGLTFKKPFKYTFRTRKDAVVLELNCQKWIHLLDFFPACQKHIDEIMSYFVEEYVYDSKILQQ